MRTAVADAEFYNDGATAWNPMLNENSLIKGAQRVTFFNKSKMDIQLSKQEGRPRYVKKPYIRVTQPGDRDNIITREAWIDEHFEEFGEPEYRMADNVRFPAEWTLFKKQQAGEAVGGATGTPLSMWPVLTSEQVEELKHFHITTVEELAGMSDANVSRFMGLRQLQRLAKDFLEAAKDGAVVSKLSQELSANEERMKNLENVASEQAETIRQLKEMLEAQKRGTTAAVEDFEKKLLEEAESLTPAHEEKVEELPAPKSAFLRPKKKE